MSALDWALLVVGLVLQVAVLSAMLKGFVRRYPFIFGYLVISPLMTVVQVAFRYYFGPKSREFSHAYWVCDFVGTFVMLMIIISLIRYAMQHHKYRNAVYSGLLLGVMTVALVSLLLMEGYSKQFRLGSWLTEMSRDYYFSAVILNAVLWVTLVRVNHPNKQLYLLSSGLGIHLTGAAIAHALRLTSSLWALATVVLVTSYLANLFIWYVAMTRFPSVAAPAGALGEIPSQGIQRTPL